MNKIKFKAVSTAVIIILVVALLALNCAAIFVPKLYTELDMSSSKIYNVSEESKELLSRVEKNVNICIFNADGSNLKLERFIKHYASESDMISVSYGSSEDYSAYTLKVESEDRFEILDSSDLFYYDTSFGTLSVDEYDYYVESFSANEAYAEHLEMLIYESVFYFNGDYILSAIIEYVVFGEIPYLVSGHGENDTQNGNFASILSALENRFKSFDITSENEIPRDISCFVINEPSEDYSESEAGLILDYLKDGGRVILVTSEKNLEMPNLMSIAKYYGLSAQKGFVAEPIPEGEGEESAEAESGESEEADPFEFVPEINPDNDLMAIFEGYTLVALNANPITKDESVDRPSLIVTNLILSSENSYVGDEETTKGSRTIGVCAEEETENGTTRFVWFTGADAFNKEEYIRSNNVALLYYGVVWMEDYSELEPIDPVVFGDSLLSIKKNAMLWCGVSMILIIPTAIIGAGVIVCMKRSKNSKKA